MRDTESAHVNYIDPEPSPADIAELEAAAPAYTWKPVPDWVTWSPISDGAFRLYVRALSLTSDYRIWYRSDRLAQLLSVSAATLHRHMSSLERHGMVARRTRRDAQGRKVSTVYRILVEPVEDPGWPTTGAQARRRIDEGV